MQENYREMRKKLGTLQFPRNVSWVYHKLRGKAWFTYCCCQIDQECFITINQNFPGNYFETTCCLLFPWNIREFFYSIKLQNLRDISMISLCDLRSSDLQPSCVPFCPFNFIFIPVKNTPYLLVDMPQF